MGVFSRLAWQVPSVDYTVMPQTHAHISPSTHEQVAEAEIAGVSLVPGKGRGRKGT